MHAASLQTAIPAKSAAFVGAIDPE